MRVAEKSVQQRGCACFATLHALAAAVAGAHAPGWLCAAAAAAWRVLAKRNKEGIRLKGSPR